MECALIVTAGEGADRPVAFAPCGAFVGAVEARFGAFVRGGGVGVVLGGEGGEGGVG